MMVRSALPRNGAARLRAHRQALGAGDGDVVDAEKAERVAHVAGCEVDPPRTAVAEPGAAQMPGRRA